MTPQIHSTAVVDPASELGPNCEIGPYCVIGPHVRLGEGCKLHAHVVIEGHTTMGRHNEVFPFASIGLKTQDLKWAGATSYTEIGDHNTFRECVTVNSATGEGETTFIGSNNHILAYSHVAHNVVLHNSIVMSNVATLAGHVVVEDYAIIGGLAAIHQFCRLGKMSIIGGCSKVSQDVAPFMLVDGNPASTRTVNKVGLQRQGVGTEAQAALRQAHRIVFRAGLSLPTALEQLEERFPEIPEVRHLIEFRRSSQRGVCR